MNFFPVGPLVRRSGVFFIRRTFKDNPIYKFVLRSYIDYLIEKRFSLEWYIEGGRSRSGKLLPPRFGLLANVVDAYRRGKSEDVILIPVAIAYDQIQDVGSYTAEQHGGKKERESFGWFVGVVRGLQNRFGDIYIRFGRPISLAQTLGPPDPLAAEHLSGDDTEEQHLTVQKLAFEVAVRINRVTPITPTSLVALALLGRGDRALSVPEILVALQNLVQYIRRRALPTTVDLGLDSPESVQRTLDALVENGVVTCVRRGSRGGVRHRPGPASHRSVLPQHDRPLLRHLRHRGDRAAARRRGPRRAAAGDVLGRGDAAARPPQVRVLLRREGALPRGAGRGDRAARRQVGVGAGARPRRHPGRRALVPALQRTSRAATVPARLPGGRRRAGAREPGRALRPERLPQPLPRPRQAVPPPAPHPERRVGLQGALRDRRSGWPATVACSSAAHRI